MLVTVKLNCFLFWWNFAKILLCFCLQLEGGLKRLTVPSDFCRLLSSECKSTPGCGSAVLVDDFDKNTTFCYSNALSKPTAPCSNEASGGALYYSNGILCEGAELSERRDCSEHKSCGECLSDFPMPDASKIGAGASTCRWCAGCNKVNYYLFFLFSTINFVVLQS